jgi:hypothetical protein
MQLSHEPAWLADLTLYVFIFKFMKSKESTGFSYITKIEIFLNLLTPYQGPPLHQCKHIVNPKTCRDV